MAKVAAGTVEPEASGLWLPAPHPHVHLSSVDALYSPDLALSGNWSITPQPRSIGPPRNLLCRRGTKYRYVLRLPESMDWPSP